MNLEEFRKKKEYKKKDMAKNAFYKYLKKKYPDFDKTEFTKAKTREEKEMVVEKYKEDFDNFVDEQPKLFIPMAVRYGLMAADVAGFVPKDVRRVLQRILFIDKVQRDVRKIAKKFED